MVPPRFLAFRVLVASGVVGKFDPRQASADDDAGKCSGGDRL